VNYLDQYIKTLDLIEEDLGKIKFKTDQTRLKVAGTLFAVAIDHAQGIKFCLQNSAYPSAAALMRVLFETYIRGMWIEKCTTDKQVNKFVNHDKIVSKDNKSLTFKEMVLEVEKDHELPVYFSVIQKHTWSGLNSLTHSGRIQLHNNFDGKTIKHCYDKEHIIEVIDFSTMLACMSYGGICDLTTDTNADLNSQNIMSFVQSWAFNQPLKSTLKSGAP